MRGLLIPLIPLAVWGLGVASAFAEEHLHVSFNEGYTEGDITGQEHGSVGGPWSTSGALYSVEQAPDGRTALRISRHGASQAHVALAKPLNTLNPGIYLSLDAFRLNGSRAYWAPLAAIGAPPMGVGVSVRGDGKVELFKNWRLERVITEFIMEPGKWHRFELEIDGAAGTFDAFVRVEGEEERVTLARQVPWETKNQSVRYFRISQPDGGPESITYTDRLLIHSNVTFPYSP